MKIRYYFNSLPLLGLLGTATAADGQVQPQLAQRYFEEATKRARQARIAELRRRFVDGPVLTMPAGGSRTSDSTGAVGIPGAGIVFFSQFHPFRSMGPPQRRRRRLDRFR
jgi:hypothetical protein